MFPSWCTGFIVFCYVNEGLMKLDDKGLIEQGFNYFSGHF